MAKALITVFQRIVHRVRQAPVGSRLRACRLPARRSTRPRARRRAGPTVRVDGKVLFQCFTQVGQHNLDLRTADVGTVVAFRELIRPLGIVVGGVLAPWLSVPAGAGRCASNSLGGVRVESGSSTRPRASMRWRPARGSPTTRACRPGRHSSSRHPRKDEIRTCRICIPQANRHHSTDFDAPTVIPWVDRHQRVGEVRLPREPGHRSLDGACPHRREHPRCAAQGHSGEP